MLRRAKHSTIEVVTPKEEEKSERSMTHCLAILSNVTSTKDDRVFDLQRVLWNIPPGSNISTETS
jgi:hypothetical protein